MNSVKQLIPNALTISRLVLLPPLFIGLFVLIAIPIAHPTPLHFILIIAVAYVGVSDGFDGILARRWNCESDFGKKLDKWADKLCMLLFIPLAVASLVHWIVLVVIFSRDLGVAILRRHIQQQTGEFMDASISGKIKTFAAYITIAILAVVLPIEDSVITQKLSVLQPALFVLSTIVMTGLYIWSAIDYTLRGKKMLAQPAKA